MSEENLAPQLCMIRENSDDLPSLNLPDGYSERCYQEGDAAAWCDIIAQSFENQRTLESFQKDMLDHPAFKNERIRFVCDPDEKPCATASAYRMEEHGLENGYVHMVGILPSQAGKKLGFAASLAVLQQFAREGCEKIILNTDDFRLAAVKTYLRLGFLPKIVDDNQYQRWLGIYKKISQEAPAYIQQGG